MTYHEFLAYLFDRPETRDLAYVLAEAHERRWRELMKDTRREEAK